MILWHRKLSRAQGGLPVSVPPSVWTWAQVSKAAFLPVWSPAQTAQVARLVECGALLLLHGTLSSYGASCTRVSLPQASFHQRSLNSFTCCQIPRTRVKSLRPLQGWPRNSPDAMRVAFFWSSKSQATPDSSGEGHRFHPLNLGLKAESYHKRGCWHRGPFIYLLLFIEDYF